MLDSVQNRYAGCHSMRTKYSLALKDRYNILLYIHTVYVHKYSQKAHRSCRLSWFFKDNTLGWLLKKLRLFSCFFSRSNADHFWAVQAVALGVLFYVVLEMVKIFDILPISKLSGLDFDPPPWFAQRNFSKYLKYIFSNKSIDYLCICSPR
jgi:hypothetical protein